VYKTAAETGDGSQVGVFIRLPDSIGSQFPKLAEDKSPPHLTMWYAGSVDKNEKTTFINIVKSVMADVRPPVMVEMDGLDYFDHPQNDGKVAHVKYKFDRNLHDVRDELRVCLQQAGFECEDYSPMVWRPHTTLAYLDGFDSKWTSHVPTGKWPAGGVQIWGFSKVIDVPFGSQTKQASIAVRVARNYIAKTATDKEWSFPDSKSARSAATKLRNRLKKLGYEVPKPVKGGTGNIVWNTTKGIEVKYDNWDNTVKIDFNVGYAGTRIDDIARRHIKETKDKMMADTRKACEDLGLELYENSWNSLGDSGKMTHYFARPKPI